MKQVNKPLNALNLRLLRFAENMASGTFRSASAAALDAGFSHHQAGSNAYAYLGKSRETAMYPALWDYYETLRNERLRKFEVTSDKVVEELRTIAFSNIADFVDLASETVHDRIKKLEKQIQKLDDDLRAHMVNDNGLMVVDPDLPELVRDQCLKDAAKIREKQRKIEQLTKGKGYRVRIKFLEEIPAELMPAVAEIRETRDGLVVKLHNKLDALDKLATWLKMYSDNAKDEHQPDLSELNLWVNGSKSNLLNGDAEEHNAA
jgi:hypothetical protein